MTYLISDIHGKKALFDRMVSEIKLSECDTLIVLGDVIDRGPDGIEILKTIMKTPNIKMLLGNHEYMMLDAIRTDPTLMRCTDEKDLWYHNGAAPTAYDFKRLTQNEKSEVVKFLDDLPINIEVTVNGIDYLCVHGGVYDGEITPEEAVWKRINTEEKLSNDKTVIFGHTPTNHYQYLPEMSIWNGGDKIGIDCGCAYPYGGRLGCLCLDTMEEFYVA